MKALHFLLVTTMLGTLSPAWAAEKSLAELKKEYKRPKSIPYPEDNKYSKEREELGKMLFFEPRLSGSQVMSCATCHNPSFSWGDGLPKAVGHGHQILGRRTPTILNLAWAEKLMWDGRANGLEDQALGPIQAEGEMNLKLTTMIERLDVLQEYKDRFLKAYPGEPMNEKTVARAIATFERGIVSGKAPFDRWIDGDNKALTANEVNGFKLFNGKANCMACHSGWAFTDHSFQDVGIDDDDIGRAKQLPKMARMNHAFKTPTLRNVSHRRPYMHNGSEKTLESVVDFYNQGGKAKRTSVSENVRPLNLTPEEKSDLVAFLKTLTSKDASMTVPVLPNH